MVLLVLLMCTCRPERPQKTTEKPPSPVSKALNDVTVAKLGDREITFKEIEQRLDSLPVFVRVRYQSPERKLEFLEAYIEFLALALAAEAEGYANAPEVVDAQKLYLVETYLRDTVDSRIKPSDIQEERIVAYYEENRHLFITPPRIEVAHIRVKDRTMADKVVFRARRAMDSPYADAFDIFSGLAKRYSDDEATRDKGGVVGLLPRLPGEKGILPKAVEEASYRLREVNDVSDPVEAEDGWHVLFLVARHPAKEITLDEARPEIVAALIEEERTRLRQEYILRLLAKKTIRVDETVLHEVAEERK